MALRSENIETYEAFKNALCALLEKDGFLFEIKAKKESFICRLALYLSSYFGPEWFIDMGVNGSELLVWDRKHTIALSLFVSKDYVSQSQKDRVIDFHKAQRPQLSLALSLLEGKDYVLIYRFETDYVDYLHIFPELGYEEKVLKRCLIEEDGEKDDPVLFHIRKKRKKKTVKEGETTTDNE